MRGHALLSREIRIFAGDFLKKQLKARGRGEYKKS